MRLKRTHPSQHVTLPAQATSSPEELRAEEPVG
jgi:hypothetical protein